MEDLGALISSFLGNPENVEKLKTVLDSFSKGAGETGDEQGALPVSERPADAGNITGAAERGDGAKNISPEKLKAALSSFPIGGDDNRARLLKALRPYLSQKRAAYADTAMGLLGVSKILGSLGDKK